MKTLEEIVRFFLLINFDFVLFLGMKQEVTYIDALPDLVKSKVNDAQAIRYATVVNEEEVQNRPPRVAKRFKMENKADFMFKRFTEALFF